MRNPIVRSTAPRTRKVWLLGTASALAMCVAVPSLGWATDLAPETSDVSVLTAIGYHTILAQPVNSFTTLSAMVTDDVGGIVGTGASAITTANSFTASVGGNDVSNTITGTTLPLPNASQPTNDGIAVLNDSLNIGVVANARVGNSTLAQEIQASNMAATVSSNAMSAAVTLNQSTTTVQGQVPINYIANTGSSAYNGALSSVFANLGSLASVTYDATGSVLATTAQFNVNSSELNGSNAMVTENQIGQIITGTIDTPTVLNSSPAVINNSMTAGFIGNAATTALSITAGGAPSFNGSTALTNVQQNLTEVGDPDVNSDSAATVKYSQIGLVVSPGDEGSIALTGAAAVTGNVITASAVGNQAAGTSLSGAVGNILTLAGGIGLNGTSTDSMHNETYFIGSDPHSDIAADALVNNWQNNVGTPLDSIVKQNFITALIPLIDGGSLAVSNNTITAQTVGNEANNALLAPGLGSPGTGGVLNGVLAMASLQTNQNSPLTAMSYQSGVPVIVYGPVWGGSVTADANAVGASATGNSVTNTVNLNSSNIASYTGFPAGTYAERNPLLFDTTTYTDDFGAYADVTVNSQQTNDINSPVTATTVNGGTTIIAALGGGGVIDSTLSVSNNATAALATGNAATNSLTLNSAAVQASAALLNAQSSYSPVTALLIDPTNGIVTGGGDPLSSTLTLNGNLQRAIATGNSASNTLSVTGSSISVANYDLPASVFYYVPSLLFPLASDGTGDNDQTNAGFVAHNDQATTAPVSATVTFNNLGSPPLILPSMGIVAIDGLTSSSADNSMNVIVAAARGNQATTQLTLAPTTNLGSVDEEPVYSPFAVVANVQTLTNGASVTASINSDAITGGLDSVPLPPIFTAVSGGLTSSTITMGGNQIETLAQGNNATNGLTLVSTGIVAAPNGTPLGLIVSPAEGDPPITTLTADAAFVVHNMQVAGSDVVVSATQDATGVQALLSGDLMGSTVMIGGATAPLGNVINASATTNLANNTLTLGAATLSASGGLANFQVSNGATAATMGETGTLPTPGSTNTVNAIASNYNSSGTFSGASQTAVDATHQSYTGWLTSTDPNSTEDGFVLGSGGLYYKNVSEYSFVKGSPVVAGDSTVFTNIIPSSPGNWGSPGLVISLNGNVTDSVLAISQNTVNATSTANSANNTVTSTSAISSSSLNLTPATNGFNSLVGVGPSASLTNAGPVVLADVGLLNTQAMGDVASSAASANGSFWVSNSAVAPVYTNATLSISNNTQQASALGNTASNLLTLSPGITPIETNPLTASILSVQTVGTSSITADSTMLITAPMAMTGSTLTIAGNTNTANAVANDVTNALTVNGTTALPGLNPSLPSYAGSGIGGGNIGAFADYTVVNAQFTANGVVTSTANTAMLNNDLYLDPATISNTSVTVDNNTTVAQALGNRASNTLTITAAGPSGATGSVANGQVNNASIGAGATIGTTFAIGQSPGTQVGSTSNNVTYNMTNNATQALATGNQASNVLNASPTAYGTAAAQSASTNVGNGTFANATYTVLNTQLNGGPVAAAVTGVSPALLSNTINTGQGGYVMALNTTGTGNVVNISGNTVTSQAIGNRASNNVVLAALNTGTASSAINSTQVNYGAISASITNTQVGAAVSGGTMGRVTNNQLVANAFGNVVANSIVTH